MCTKKYTIYFILLITILYAPHVALAQCINTFPHVEDFEAAPTWTAVTAPTSSVAGTCDWTWGTPNHTYVIQSAGSGNKCWCAGGLSGSFYNYNQESYIYSPCYDFTNLQYPHIKFRLFYDTEFDYDGGNLQSSIDGGTTWQDIGSVADSSTFDCNTAYWYNYGSITYLNKPTGFVASKDGWCGNVELGGVGYDTDHPAVSCVGGHGLGHWVTAEHCLTGLAGQSNVIFRFTFGAGYSCNDFDGLAIDSVAIGNGINNSATYTHSCVSVNTVDFMATPNACPTNTYKWDFGDPSSGASNTSTSQNSSHTFSAPGSYTVSLIASGGACNPPDTVTQVVNILSAEVTSFSNASCGSLGSATVTVTSGINPINYSWSPSGGNSNIASNLSAGTYTCSVSDSASCPTTATVNITASASLSVNANATPISCSTAGSAMATPNGGTAPYSYTWSPSGGHLNIAGNLSAGNYTVNVTDNSGCTGSATVGVNNNSYTITANITSTNVSCNGGSDGSAVVTPNGGINPYSYTWSPGGGNSATTTNLSTGNYTVLISDSNMCATTSTISITQPSALSAIISSTATTCGNTNGAANVSINGGRPNYAYTWQPSGGNNATASGLATGNYTVLISDANGCTITAVASIAPSTSFSLAETHSDASCNGFSDGTASVSIQGGTPVYNYIWNPNVSANSTANNLSAGNYGVIVSDQNSCLDSINITINEPPSLSVVATATATTCNLPNGSVIANVSGGTPSYSIVWAPDGNFSFMDSNLPSGNYTVTVTDNNGCIASVQTNVAPSSGAPAINFSENPGFGCAPVCALFSAVAAPVLNDTITSWNWDFGDGNVGTGDNPNHCYTVNGTYSVSLTATDQNGCKDSITKFNVINVYPTPVADFYASPSYTTDVFSPTFNFFDESQSNITSWQWTFGDGTSSTTESPIHTYENEGTYPVMLIVTNNSGCKDTLIKEVIVNPIYTFYAPNCATPNGDGINEIFMPVGTGWDDNTYHLWIYDRWGILFFQTTNPEEGWNGTHHNSVVQEDTYVWKVSLKDVFGQDHQYHGIVSIVR